MACYHSPAEACPPDSVCTGFDPVKKTRRFVRLFKPRFAELIRSGAKRQTIRPMPKRMPEAGDIIDCRQWSGLPYRSKQIRVGQYKVEEVGAVVIRSWSVALTFIDRRELMFAGSQKLRDFAQADGFDGWADMHEWFIENHDLPFHGILIKWRHLCGP